MIREYFGTDGIRGRVGRYPITPDFMLKLGWAAGRVLGSEGRSKVLIGKDTRISGYMFESALEAGLSAAGTDSYLLGPLPTPAIAYLTRTLRAEAGIVISASHNPYEDNGIKFFSGRGTKLPDDVELRIEAELDKPMETVAPEALGKAVRVNDARGRYIEFCKSTIPAIMEFTGLTIVVDCANGATYQTAPEVFAELGADVIPYAVEPNGFNINDECGSTKPQALRAAVLEHRADLGIAFDGDGDRVVMVDHTGEVVDGDELLFIIAQERKAHGRLVGGVVGTLMSNLGLEVALAREGIQLVRAKVGDRYIMERLVERDWVLGGENSGHIICLDRTSTGDGIVAALQVLVALHNWGRSLHEMKQGMTKFPQRMINVRVDGQRDLETSRPIQDGLRAAEAALNGRGRVLLRPSGTEPVVRVMVEGEDEPLVDSVAQALAEVVEQTLCAPA